MGRTLNIKQNQNHNMASSLQHQQETADRPDFLEYRQSEVMKENIEITDQIFDDLKEIHALQREKRRLFRERFEILENAHPKQYALVKDRSTMEAYCSPQINERYKWEKQRDVIEKTVFKVGQYIQVQKEYVDTANDTVHRYIGDHLKHLVNTKLDYIIYLTKQLATTSSKEQHKQQHLLKFSSSKKKQIRQHKCELDNNLMESCRAFQEKMNVVLEQCSTSETLWSIDNTRDRHKYEYAWHNAFTKPSIPQNM